MAQAQHYPRPSIMDTINRVLSPILEATIGTQQLQPRQKQHQQIRLADVPKTQVSDIPAGLMGSKCPAGGKRFHIKGDNPEGCDDIDLVVCKPESRNVRPLPDNNERQMTYPVTNVSRPPSLYPRAVLNQTSNNVSRIRTYVPRMIDELKPTSTLPQQRQLQQQYQYSPSVQSQRQQVSRVAGGCGGNGRRNGGRRSQSTRAFSVGDDEDCMLSWQREIFQSLNLNCDIDRLCVVCIPRKCNGCRPIFAGGLRPLMSSNGGAPSIIPGLPVLISLANVVNPTPAANWDPITDGVTVLVFTTSSLEELESTDNPDWVQSVVLAPDRPPLMFLDPEDGLMGSTCGRLELSSYSVRVPTSAVNLPESLSNLNAVFLPDDVRGRQINIFAFNVLFKTIGNDNWEATFCGGVDGAGLQNVDVDYSPR